MQKKKPKSARAQRREKARAEGKIARGRETLAAHEEGGSPARPIAVESPSQIEPHASSMRCLHCEAAYRVEEHAAETLGGHAVRVVRVRCPARDARRTIYFQLRVRQLN